MRKSKTDKHTAEINVTRAVQTDLGDTYCLVTKDKKRHWVSLTEIVDSPKTVLADLARAGIPLVSSKAVSNLRNLLQDHPKPTLALVASQPGWLADNVYVHPNGDIQKGQKVDAEIIVAFLADSAYGSAGSEDEWKKAIAPYIEEHDTMTFLLAYGFASVLIAKVRPSPQNPIVELFGAREAGKSTIAMGVGSIFGGCPEGDIGIGRTANATPASFKPVQRMANDTLLFLDETNIVDKAVEENLKLFFDHTSRDERLRHGSTSRSQPIRNALLLTGNQRLAERSKAALAIVDAAKSRCLSIDVEGQVFKGKNLTTSDHEKRLVGLRNASNQFYGTASRAFIERIIAECEKDKDAFAKRISKLMAQFREKMPEAEHLPNRLKTTIALSCAAGYIAWKWRIWPSKKRTILTACSAIYEEAGRMSARDVQFTSPAIKRLVELIQSHAGAIEVCEKTKKRSPSVKAGTVGYMVNEGKGTSRFFFEADAMERLLGASMKSDLKEIRQHGFLKGEKGSSSRLASKAPSYIPTTKRVYEFNLPSALLS